MEERLSGRFSCFCALVVSVILNVHLFYPDRVMYWFYWYFCNLKHNGRRKQNNLQIPNSGTKVLRFNGSAGENKAMILLPELTIPNGTTIAFYTCPEDKTKSGSFALGYYKDDTFTSLFNYNGSDFASAKTHEFKTETLNDIPEGARLAFSQSPQTAAWYWYVDDIAIYTYPQPTNLTYTNATPNYC